jgi:hypothetical protein
VDDKKTRTIPRHLQLALKNDEELNKFLGGIFPKEGDNVGLRQKDYHPLRSVTTS